MPDKPNRPRPALRLVKTDPVAPEAVLRKAVIDAQAVLAQYLEPGGIDAEEALDRLLVILDHEDVVEAAIVCAAQARDGELP